MNIKQLKYVAEIADKKSISAAAESLGITQPSLSQYIRNIENSLGVVLFERVGNSLRLTDAGRVYVDNGRKIIDIEKQMENAFMDIREDRRGYLTIGCAPFRTAGILPKAAARFLTEYPGYRLRIEERVTSELLEGTERGEFDFSLTTYPFDESLFDSVPISEEEYILALPASYPPLDARRVEGRKHPAIHAEDIKNGKFITLGENQVMQKALDKFLSDFGIEIKPVISLTNLSSQISMVRSGVGMAFVPSGIENICPDGEVRYYSIVEELPKRKTAVIYRKGISLPGSALRFIGLLKEC